MLQELNSCQINVLNIDCLIYIFSLQAGPFLYMGKSKAFPHSMISFGPRRKKTGLRGFQTGKTQTGLYSHRSRLAASNFGFKKKRNCTILVAKTKALISCAVTAQLICAFVFAYAKIRFSHDAAHLVFERYHATLTKSDIRLRSKPRTK